MSDERDDEFGSEIGDSAASSGSDDPDVLEEHQEQAEQGAAQGGKGRAE